MNHQDLFQKIVEKRSYLCVGLDSEIEKIPASVKGTERIFEFNKKIIDATQKFTVAYKLNVAFYESNGLSGWKDLRSTADYIKENYPDIFIIADAKRGDIGNTSRLYAKTFLQDMPFDAVTVAPYMGEDSISPFLSYDNKWAIILALTSNKGADDFQYHSDDGIRLFERVLNVSKKWGNLDNIMYVVGATHPEMLVQIRKLVPDHFLLVPGVGAQGGSLEEVSKYGLNSKCGLLVNSSRGIIFASDKENYARIAGEKAEEMQVEMEKYLRNRILF
ncbi:MAG TPA: orotidine-5'-phosphate decarboxylase [Bacteroidales bacterium]|nr:orotidine-5'-phosphate decarboxylase [Bacteroidales bacterium]